MFVTSVFLVVGLASEVIEQRTNQLTSLSSLLCYSCFVFSGLYLFPKKLWFTTKILLKTKRLKKEGTSLINPCRNPLNFQTSKRPENCKLYILTYIIESIIDIAFFNKFQHLKFRFYNTASIELGQFFCLWFCSTTREKALNIPFLWILFSKK